MSPGIQRLLSRKHSDLFPDEDYMEPMIQPSEESELRSDQAKRVMPMIGPLLDVWESIGPSGREEVAEISPALSGWLDTIDAEIDQ